MKVSIRISETRPRGNEDNVSIENLPDFVLDTKSFDERLEMVTRT
jgi:hypothetical protein